jgi:predicted exporter
LRPGRARLLLAWCALLALGTWWTSAQFQLSADLRHFLPTPRTDAQRLLLQNIGESPASRMLLLAVEGTEPAALARISSGLKQALAGRSEIAFVANGTEDASSFPEDLLSYRYLISDSFDAAPLDSARLTRELETRATDMASPAASMFEEILPRDPTLELLRLTERWQPREEPRRVDGAWFSRDGRRALLAVETRAAAFDPDGQTHAIALIRAEFARVRGTSAATLLVTGSGFFSATIKQQMQREARMFGAVATVGLLLLMWIAYRRWIFLLLGALPLVSGAVAGLAAVGLLFDSVHGITLAFGFTLIGVAQDYPVHLFSHLRHDQSPLVTARALWKPLLTGVASTCIAYLAFLVSGVTGLAQLACLTVTGLAVAAACTRFLMPRVIEVPTTRVESSRWLVAANDRLLRLPALTWLPLPILLACAVALYAARGSFWQDDLSRLTPVAPQALQFDAELRRELPTPDLRHLVVVSAAQPDEVLARLEALDASLGDLMRRNVIGGFEHAAQFLPSQHVQRRRQLSLPPASSLRSMLDSASAKAGFNDGVFAPFLEDVQRARELPLLRLEQIMQTPLAARLGTLLFERDGRWHGLVTFHDIGDAATLAREMKAQADVTFLDLKEASQELVKAQRTYILQCLSVAAAALLVVILLALRSVRRALRVLAPMLITTAVVVSVLRVSGVQLNLFHLISLLLAAGLGLDYALFFEHSSAADRDQERTLHALLICALSTLLVFALLALSRAPVLQAIGVTVSIGVVSNFLLALALSRERRTA